ncbi:MAG: nuclear transport factor 2 family protein, partial [Stackebrandtia sp.]
MATEFLTADHSVTGYRPTDDEVDGLRDWFNRYDGHSASGEIERMAAMADFPVNLVTDGSNGDAWTGQWSR